MANTITREGEAEHAAAHGFVTGTITGFVVVTGIALGIALNAGADVVPAIGIGTFAGFWGGPGFGGMIGATLASTRTIREQDVSVTTGQNSDHETADHRS